MNTARMIQSFGHETLNQKGLRLGDELSLSPAQGRKKTLRLNYGRYILKTAEIFDCEKVGSTITLPQLSGDEFHCELFLCSPCKSKQDDQARFLLRSLNGVPFRLNGILCFEAFIEREDRFDLGYNRFQTFMPSGSLQGSDSLLQGHNSLIQSSLNILIEGETGTGKTRLARLIHEQSERKGKFVHLNISSFASGLLESELFGHVKGAFTGALSNKKGALAQADGGTLFLDEIDSLPWDIQTKLLLFLDDQKIKAVGSEQLIQTNTRLIFASGRSLKELVQEKKMRKDFFFRLSSGHSFQLAPLRENIKMIKELCQQFEREEHVSLSPQLIPFYQELPWPGNIRQLLGHLMKKKVLSRSGHLLFDEEDQNLRSENKGQNSLEENNIIPLERFKNDYVKRVYNMNERRLKKTATLLQISAGTLRGILREKDHMATMELKYT